MNSEDIFEQLKDTTITNYEPYIFRLNDLILTNSNDKLAHHNLGIIFSKLKRYKEAERCLKMAIDKGSDKSIYSLAVLYDNLEKYQEAEKYYILSKSNWSLNNLAVLYDNLKRYKEAEKYYKMAIENGIIDSIHSLALMYEDTQKFNEAEKYYKLAIEKGSTKSINNLAAMYDNLERYQEAEKYYKMAIDKGDIDAIDNLANMYDYLNTKICSLCFIDNISYKSMITLKCGHTYHDFCYRKAKKCNVCFCKKEFNLKI